MTEKYKNKYRIASARLQNWDYGSNAAYFITICTHNREHFFGEIENNKMKLSEIGEMANKYWYEIPEHFPFVKLDAFIVMPNHIHGIIIIDKPVPPLPRKNKFGTQSQNLASIIRGYKIGVTKNAKKINPLWQWQSRFYDHIIRNEKSFINIRNYIIENPLKWDNDKFYDK